MRELFLHNMRILKPSVTNIRIYWTIYSWQIITISKFMIHKKFIFVSLTNEITFLHLPRESPYLWWLNWNSYFQGLALQSRKLNKIYILGKYPLVMYLFSFALQRNSECYGKNVFLFPKVNVRIVTKCKLFGENQKCA